MTTFEYKVKRESAESQREGGRYNPAKVLLWAVGDRKYRAILPCGSSDEYDVFRDGSELFCVSRNTGLGYAGLSRYDYDPGGEVDTAIGSSRITVIEDAENVFFQSAEQEFEHSRWEEWTLRTLAKRLQEWMA